MSCGFLYCMSNPSMPGILKIGFTKRTPEIILMEANIADTWHPPTPYKLEIAKCVYDPMAKKKSLHKIFGKERVNAQREFFRVAIEDVSRIFDIMDDASNEKQLVKEVKCVKEPREDENHSIRVIVNDVKGEHQQNDKKTSGKPRSFKCFACNKDFRSLNSLSDHFSRGLLRSPEGCDPPPLTPLRPERLRRMDGLVDP